MLKLVFRRNHVFGLVLPAIAVAFQNCSRPVSMRSESKQASVSTSTPDGTTPGSGAPGSGGGKFTCAGSISVATANGVVAKIQNGLQGNANSMAGNFARALT